MANHVDLGFVSETESWRLSSYLFPSKVGGKPAWLSLKSLPTSNDLQCKKCTEPCLFLLQTYAPWNEKPSCFHRTIFVFVCMNPACCKLNDSSNFIVMRSQLPKVNDFYAEEPYDEEPPKLGVSYPRAENYQSLCALCGCVGPKSCSRCKAVSYCSRRHQAMDWKARHKRMCGSKGDHLLTQVSLHALLNLNGNRLFLRNFSFGCFSRISNIRRNVQFKSV